MPKNAAGVHEKNTDPELENGITQKTRLKKEPLLPDGLGVNNFARPLRDPARKYDPMDDEGLVTIGGRR